MKSRSCLAFSVLLLFILSTTALAAKGKKKPAAAEANAPDFAMSPAFLEFMRQGHSILPTLKFSMGDHSKLHTLDNDCEMHVAAKLVGQTFGNPPSFILEPPNLCKIGLNGQAEDMSPDWATAFDGIKGQQCEVSGFVRVFTEHAKSGGGPSNPLHFFEVHPATAIHCPNKSFNYGHDYLKVFQGMRAIKPGSASSCLEQRTLKVRYNARNRMYEFREKGGTCGNFAVFELDNIPVEWIQDVGKGHSAIVRGSADGETMTTLKIYTLEDSAIDTWLANLKQNGRQERKIVLGLFSYDYFAIQKVLYNQTTKTWSKPADWTEIPYPLVVVVYGELDEAPWEE